MGCGAVLSIKGENFPCEKGDESHLIHGNSHAEAIWTGDEREE